MQSIRFRNFISLTPISQSANSRRFFSTGNSQVLVVAEHDNKKLISSTLHTIGAAKKLSNNITVLLAGNFKGKQTITNLF